MTFYEEYEQVYKCTQHYNSKRRRSCNGICPYCLKERLLALCPNCANLHPCSCSSSSLSLGRISTLIENEPPFIQRSRSSALPLFRSSRFSETLPNEDKKSSSLSFWSLLFGKNSRSSEKMTRSKSVASTIGKDVVSGKGKGWYFPSPMKVFHYSKASKVANERSPLHRG